VRRKSTLTAAAAGTAALAGLALTGCGAVDKALDCARTATTVAQAADDLQQAASDAADQPEQAQESLNKIDKNLDKIGDSTGDTDLNKAVDHLRSSVDDASKDIDAGRTPDAGEVGSAANELSQVCKPS
jgi:copper homeostasis protein CutC